MAFFLLFGVRYFLVLLLCGNAFAFSLLGPAEPWQTRELGYNVSGMEVGAPKNIGEEYRWNIPVITYGFDRSFVDYFGAPGIRAVDDAVRILNEVPRADQITLTNYTFDSRRVNYPALDLDLVDLKSTTLSLLLRQYGLAPAESSVWMLRGREVLTNGSGGAVTNYLVVTRNFDPTSYGPSAYVNVGRYTYEIFEWGNPPIAAAVDFPADPNSSLYGFSSVSYFTEHGDAFMPYRATYLTGFTGDDVGGIRYLLNEGNVNHEPLPSGVRAASTNALVAEALRPGRGKLTWEKITEAWQTQSGWNKTVRFTDSYYDDGVLKSQEVERTMTRPDIVFSAADLGLVTNSINPVPYKMTGPKFRRSSVLADAAGPGIMEPGIEIVFGMLGKTMANVAPQNTEQSGIRLARWGSFDHTTNAPVAYPVITFGAPTVEVALTGSTAGAQSVQWTVRGVAEQRVRIQVSGDLANWAELETVTLTNGTHRFSTANNADNSRFLRVVRVQ
ncbi:MAG TPA: hypothetical protein VF773_22775 [Verrucomicrobiae bacterium]